MQSQHRLLWCASKRFQAVPAAQAYCKCLAWTVNDRSDSNYFKECSRTSKRLCVFQALPSSWKLTRTFPDVERLKSPLLGHGYLSMSIRFRWGNPLSARQDVLMEGASLFSMEGKIHVHAKGFDFVTNTEHIQLIGINNFQR
jgi:hypothetical protein